jgi:predicted AAA+ superfamily ATPase
VNLQTNFGGGKTHSMLAIWHLAGHRLITEFPLLDTVIDLTLDKHQHVRAGVARIVYRPFYVRYNVFGGY